MTLRDSEILTLARHRFANSDDKFICESIAHVAHIGGQNKHQKECLAIIDWIGEMLEGNITLIIWAKSILHQKYIELNDDLKKQYRLAYLKYLIKYSKEQEMRHSK